MELLIAIWTDGMDNATLRPEIISNATHDRLQQLYMHTERKHFIMILSGMTNAIASCMTNGGMTNAITSCTFHLSLLPYIYVADQHKT